MEAFSRSGTFLCALFVILLQHLKDIDTRIADIAPASNVEAAKLLPAKFQLLMTAGQKFSSQGQKQRHLYMEVIDLANKVCPLYNLYFTIFRQISLLLYRYWCGFHH